MDADPSGGEPVKRYDPALWAKTEIMTGRSLNYLLLAGQF